MALLTRNQIEEMGFAYVGKNVSLSDKASFYNCGGISIDDNSRIDDFCVLSAGAGGISIGKNVHIAVFCSLLGRGRIEMHDFSGLSARVSLYSSSDDYTGRSMTNPTLPPQFTNVLHADVILGKHVIIGAGSIVLPGVVLEDGVAVGALSLVKKRCHAFGVYSGNPARRVLERKRKLLEVEEDYLVFSSKS